MLRRIRLATGLVLFAYVTTHLMNHALGLISYQAMEDGRQWFLALWRNWPATIVLYGSLLIHFCLALWAIYERRKLTWSWGEGLRVILGISIPLLLAAHVVGTRGAHELAGTNDNYAFVLLLHFKFLPEIFWKQIFGLLAAWIHGCMGIYYWLRLKPWFDQWKLALFSIALLLPTFAILGYIDGGQAVVALLNDSSWWQEMRAEIGAPSKEQRGVLSNIRDNIFWGVVFSVVLALIARYARILIVRRRDGFSITYADGPTAKADRGNSILDTSRLNNIPHAQVCGGRGRCSTCRVRIMRGEENLPPVSDEEQKVLDRINAGPGIRLACQTRPTGNVSVMRLLPPNADASDGHARPAYLSGEEREIVILFADIRGFTTLSEEKLPYDVVFVLNRYFASMGSAIRDAGGHIDKFIGDGVMALFGANSTPEEAARQSLDAAKRMAAALDRLNASLEGEIPEPLRIGIGLHAGPAIIGEMGYREATTLTAIGDAVNTASRLESMTKEYGAQLVISEDVARLAGVDLEKFPRHELDVRGRAANVQALVVKSAHDLPDIINPGG